MSMVGYSSGIEGNLVFDQFPGMILYLPTVDENWACMYYAEN